MGLKLGNKCWCSEQRQQQLVPKGCFRAFFTRTPASNPQQMKAQVCTRATSAHRSLISFNDRSESQGLECSCGSLESQHRQSLGAASGGQALCKGIFSFQRKRECNYFICQWFGICINAVPLLKNKSMISSENQECFVFSGKLPLPNSNPPLPYCLWLPSLSSVFKIHLAMRSSLFVFSENTGSRSCLPTHGISSNPWKTEINRVGPYILVQFWMP